MVLTGLAGVAAGVLVFVAVVAFTGSEKVKSQLGDDQFVVGRARRLANTVERRGPLLFQDLLGGDRDIYVQHLPGLGWRAFEAHAPGAPRRCQLRWRPGSGDFVDPCDNRVYPGDGSGLDGYRTSVKKGKLNVDLRSPLKAPQSS